MVCAINSHHSSTRRSIRQKLVSLLRAQLLPFSQDPNPDSTNSDLVLNVFDEASVAEVSKLIAKLLNMTSPLDYIHMSVLKSCSDVMAPLIVHWLTFHSQKEGLLTCFEVAQVTPLLKKD